MSHSVPLLLRFGLSISGFCPVPFVKARGGLHRATQGRAARRSFGRDEGHGGNTAHDPQKSGTCDGDA